MPRGPQAPISRRLKPPYLHQGRQGLVSKILPPSCSLPQGPLPQSHTLATLLCCPLIPSSRSGRCMGRWGAGPDPASHTSNSSNPASHHCDLVADKCPGPHPLGSSGFRTWETSRASWSPQLTSPFVLKESKWGEMWRGEKGHLSIHRPTSSVIHVGSGGGEPWLRSHSTTFICVFFFKRIIYFY